MPNSGEHGSGGCCSHCFQHDSIGISNGAAEKHSSTRFVSRRIEAAIEVEGADSLLQAKSTEMSYVPAPEGLEAQRETEWLPCTTNNHET